MKKLSSVIKTILLAGLVTAGGAWAHESGDIIVRGGLRVSGMWAWRLKSIIILN